jgi:hypothetical protein
MTAGIEAQSYHHNHEYVVLPPNLPEQVSWNCHHFPAPTNKYKKSKTREKMQQKQNNELKNDVEILYYFIQASQLELENETV